VKKSPFVVRQPHHERQNAPVFTVRPEPFDTVRPEPFDTVRPEPVEGTNGAQGRLVEACSESVELERTVLRAGLSKDERISGAFLHTL
jgi:hypothetical protein